MKMNSTTMLNIDGQKLNNPICENIGGGDYKEDNLTTDEDRTWQASFCPTCAVNYFPRD